MAKKHEEHEEHADETWLVPYADVLTLLLALFIVLFAMSKVDSEKFKQISESFRAALGTGSGVGSGVGILDGSNAVEPRLAPTSAESLTQASADMEEAQLQGLAEQLHAYIEENELQTMITTEVTPEGITMTLRDSLFFAPGSAEVLPSAQPIADNLARMLNTINQKVIIGGHTDNTRISTAEFPSNWDLSSKRAVNFMKYLFMREPSLRPERFSAVGYGEYQPLLPNYTDEGRQRNRRVEINILRNYRPPTGAVLQK